MNKLLCAAALSFVAALTSVNAADANKARTVTLKWTAHTQTVAGYEVYYGRSADQTRMRELFVPRTLNLKAPAVEYDLLRDLKVEPGQAICFRVKAYNNAAKSGFSSPVCTKAPNKGSAESAKDKNKKKPAQPSKHKRKKEAALGWKGKKASAQQARSKGVV
jgi:nitrogen fixation protein FixH